MADASGYDPARARIGPHTVHRAPVGSDTPAQTNAIDATEPANGGAVVAGRFVEWCVVLPKSFQHFSFELVPRLHHSIVFFLPAFSLAWLEAIGPVGDSVSSDSVEQLIVESLTAS